MTRSPPNCAAPSPQSMACNAAIGTPGRIITSRAIVTCVADSNENPVRRELSGNLCRCTDYVGIVKAVRRVIDERAGVTGR